MTVVLYTVAGGGVNNFLARVHLSSDGDQDALPPMDEACLEPPHSGVSCCKAQFLSRFNNWGGWYLMNGMLGPDDSSPVENWGKVKNAGVDLSGATELSFWARGKRGGERVEFFCFGVGRDPDTGRPVEGSPYPDSAYKRSTGIVTLSSRWKHYMIDIHGRNAAGRLGAVLGGFGWVAASGNNHGRDIIFYYDDVQYNVAHLSQPHLMVSYAAKAPIADFDKIMSNVAFTYDNAVALLAFLAVGDRARAKIIADALIYAQKQDRFYADGRIRTAYEGGDLALPNGWKPHGRLHCVRTPSYYDPDKQASVEDPAMLSTNTGNVAWAMLALITYHQMTVKSGASIYLTSAEKMGEWVEANCRNGGPLGGYTAGNLGDDGQAEPLQYRATEHNIDLYVCFERLYLLTKAKKWHGRAEHARAFIARMWDAAGLKLYTGTKDVNSDEPNIDVIPVDIQAWAVLALRNKGKEYWPALDYASDPANGITRVGGFGFSNKSQAVWYEGTAQMAAAYRYIGQKDKSDAILSFLKSRQLPSGAMNASSRDNMDTGFNWKYFQRPHVGATAWLVLAETGVNPYWLGVEGSGKE
jgi:hypothetical protein